MRINSEDVLTLSPSEFIHRSEMPPLFVIQWFYLLNSFALFFFFYPAPQRLFPEQDHISKFAFLDLKIPAVHLFLQSMYESTVFNFPGLLWHGLDLYTLTSFSSSQNTRKKETEWSLFNPLITPFLEAAQTTQVHSTNFKEWNLVRNRPNVETEVISGSWN